MDDLLQLDHTNNHKRIQLHLHLQKQAAKTA